MHTSRGIRSGNRKKGPAFVSPRVRSGFRAPGPVKPSISRAVKASNKGRSARSQLFKA